MVALCALMFIFSPKKCERMSDTETNRSDEDNSPFSYLLSWNVHNVSFIAEKILRNSQRQFDDRALLLRSFYFFSAEEIERVEGKWEKLENRERKITIGWKILINSEDFEYSSQNEDRTNERKSKHAHLFLSSCEAHLLLDKQIINTNLIGYVILLLTMKMIKIWNRISRNKSMISSFNVLLWTLAE